MNCDGAVCGLRRWIIQPCRKIGSVSVRASLRSTPAQIWTKLSTFSLTRLCRNRCKNRPPDPPRRVELEEVGLDLMPQHTETPLSRLEATYKAREVEGVLDLYFYRPIGFRLAEFFVQLKMTPGAVTLLAGICGVVAGHLYYYRDLRINRSEEHTSELQSQSNLVCRLLLEKKKIM